MKRNILLAIILLFSVFLFGQTPNKMSYQAVIRGATSDLITNKTVGVRISILNQEFNKTPVYVETHNLATNSNGLLSLEIGTGEVLNGNFSTIDWSKGKYYIKTETDITGGTNYTIIGESQLLSVPYALHAKTVAHYDEKVTTLEQEGKTGKIIYTDEAGKSNSINVLSTDVDNQLEIGTDGGLLFRAAAGTEPWRDINGNPATNTSTKINFMGGKVGIGTTNPSYQLTVDSNTSSATALFKSSSHSITRLQTIADDKIAGLYFQNPVQQYSFYLTPNTNNFYLRDVTNNKTILTAKTNGNVGIGTTNPYYKFMVSSDINGTALFQSSVHNITRMRTTASDKIVGLYFQNPIQQYAWYLGTDRSFKLLNATNATVSLTAKDNGNIGIGTTAPTEKLEVNGIAQLGKNSATYGGVQMFGKYSGKNHINTYGSERGSGTTAIGYAVQPKTGAKGYESSAQNTAFTRGLLRINGSMQFLTAEKSAVSIGNDIVLTPRLTVANNGNTGIGTTRPKEKLEVKGNIKTSGSLQLGTISGVLVGSPCSSVDAGKIIFNGTHFCACDGLIWKQVD